MSKDYDDGWSAKKCGVFWIGGIVLALVVGGFIAVVTNIVTTGGTERLHACLDSGSKISDCQVALN